MEILFIFSIRGIIYGMTVAGQEQWFAVRWGFTSLPWEEQKAELIKGFKEGLEKFSGTYKVLFVINDGRKKYLQKAIQKYIKYLLATYDNDDHLYWEGIDVYCWDFDKYNKDIAAEL